MIKPPTDAALRSVFKSRFGRDPSPSEFDALLLISTAYRARPRIVLGKVAEHLRTLETPSAIWFNVRPRRERLPTLKPDISASVADAYLADDATPRRLRPVLRYGRRIFLLDSGNEGWREATDELRFVLVSDLPPRAKFDAYGRLLDGAGTATRRATSTWRELPDRD